MGTSTDVSFRPTGACPRCNCEDCEGGFVDIDGGTATQECACTNCEAEFINTYTLTGQSVLSNPPVQIERRALGEE